MGAPALRAIGRRICVATDPLNAVVPALRTAELLACCHCDNGRPKAAPKDKNDLNWLGLAVAVKPVEALVVGSLPFDPGGALDIVEIGTPCLDWKFSHTSSFCTWRNSIGRASCAAVRIAADTQSSTPTNLRKVLIVPPWIDSRHGPRILAKHAMPCARRPANHSLATHGCRLLALVTRTLQLLGGRKDILELRLQLRQFRPQLPDLLVMAGL